MQLVDQLFPTNKYVGRVQISERKRSRRPRPVLQAHHIREALPHLFIQMSRTLLWWQSLVDKRAARARHGMDVLLATNFIVTVRRGGRTAPLPRLNHGFLRDGGARAMAFVESGCRLEREEGQDMAQTDVVDGQGPRPSCWANGGMTRFSDIISCPRPDAAAHRAMNSFEPWQLKRARRMSGR